MSAPTWQIKGKRNAIKRMLCSHTRIVYGPFRDICIDCLAVIDEHSNGRGREE